MNNRPIRFNISLRKKPAISIYINHRFTLNLILDGFLILQSGVILSFISKLNIQIYL